MEFVYPTATAINLYHKLKELGERDHSDFPERYYPEIRSTLRELGVKRYGQVAFTLPWMSPEDCDQLRTEFKLSEYSVNDEEPEDARIPEIVLAEHHPDLHDQLAQLFSKEMLSVVGAVTGHEVKTFESIQLAKYSPEGVAQGTWHTDQDSDITITVALNDDYEGGGLKIAEGGQYGEVHNIPKLPQGTATIFFGRTCLHKGLKVTKGTRDLLVFWCKI